LDIRFSTQNAVVLTQILLRIFHIYTGEYFLQFHWFSRLST